MHFAVPFQVCCMAHCQPAREWKPLTSAVPAMRNESTDVSARVLPTVRHENMSLFTACQLRLKQKVSKYFKLSNRKPMLLLGCKSTSSLEIMGMGHKGAHFLSAYDLAV